MAEIKALLDEYGVIYDAHKLLPDTKHRLQFLEALAELENNDCHKNRHFPVTRLHKVTGVKQAIYRADIDKISGWRLHIQYSKDGVFGVGAEKAKDLRDHPAPCEELWKRKELAKQSKKH